MPRKWGQHFLKRVPIDLFKPIEDFLNSLPSEQSEPTVSTTIPNIHILEIGPGRGAVTKALINFLDHKTKQLLPKYQPEISLSLVEIDPQFIPHLASLVPTDHAVVQGRVVQSDFLQYDFKSYLRNVPSTDPIFIIGSLPYESSKKIIKKVVDDFYETYYSATTEKDSVKPSAQPHTNQLYCTFIVQKEVGEAYAAEPPQGTFLSNWIRMHTINIRAFHKIKPKEFSPPPQVDSNILQFSMGSREPLAWNLPPAESQKLIAFIRRLFQQQRKQIGSVIKNKNAVKPELKPILKKRPQNTTLAEFFLLYKQLFTNEEK